MTDTFVPEVSAGNFELHEEDRWYLGIVADVEYEAEGQYGPQFKIIYSLDEDDNDHLVFDWRTTKVSTDDRNRLRKWLKGVTGEIYPEAGVPPSLKSFVGKRVKLMFEQYSGKDGNTKERVERIKAA